MYSKREKGDGREVGSGRQLKDGTLVLRGDGRRMDGKRLGKGVHRIKGCRGIVK